MALPIMLFTMGLMLIIGTAGAWKVRTLTNSRQAAWRAFAHRTGNNDDNPPGWPTSAEMNASSAQPEVISSDPFAGHVVVRGPVVSGTGTGVAIPVDQQLLEMTDGTISGHARIERDYVVLAKMKPGRFDFPRDTHVFDGTRWQIASMGISNLSRRILSFYDFDLAMLAPDATQRFLDAALAIYLSPNRTTSLTPLEGGDPEVYELLGQRSPDFQPQIQIGSERSTIDALGGRTLLPTYCEDEPETVRREKINDDGNPPNANLLIPRIRRVPQQMKSYYLSVYNRVKSQLEAMEEPRPAGVEQMISELEQKIEELNQFQP